MPRPLTPEQIDEVRRLFPDHTKQEIRLIVGCGSSSIDRIQARFHLRKSEEHLHNMGVRAGKASNIARGGDSSSCYTPEAIAKRVESFKRTFHEDQIRWKWGLETRTKLKVKKQPKAKCNQRSYLKKQGYIIDDEKHIAYWTEDTIRATRLERVERGVQKGAFKPFYTFKPYEH